MTEPLWKKRICPNCGAIGTLAWEDMPWTQHLQVRCLECGYVAKVTP